MEKQEVNNSERQYDNINSAEISVENTENNCDSESDSDEKEPSDEKPQRKQYGKYGKFSDAESLLNAYQKLQAEFTKKCKILAQLKADSTSAKDNGDVPPDAPHTDYGSAEFVEKNILTNKAAVDRVITEYLKELSRQCAPRTISADGGVTPLSPPMKPKTIEEAGRMAAIMLNRFASD